MDYSIRSQTFSLKHVYFFLTTFQNFWNNVELLQNICRNFEDFLQNSCKTVAELLLNFCRTFGTLGTLGISGI